MTHCCHVASSFVPSRRLTAALALAALAAAAATGCGQAQPERVAVYPVSGKVTFKGQPAPGAIVALHPKAGPLADVPTPRASVGKDGTFQVSTFAGSDGAPVGEYVLTVLWYKPVKKDGDLISGPNVIPRKYASPQTSDKIVTVAAGDNNLQTIQL